MQAKSSLGLDVVALIVAGMLHLLLVAVLLMQGLTRDPLPEPTRITVNFAEEVGMTSTAPNPTLESQASVAPELGEAAPPPIEYAPPPPLPVQTSAPAQATRQPSRTSQRTERRETRQASQTTPTRSPARTTPPARTEQPPETRRSGGSRVGNDFLAGQGDSTTTSDTRTPAATFGAAERSALSAAITRQLRPHWSAPTGIDAEKLVSVVSWRLGPDGRLRGRPSCRTVPGSVTDSNRPQADLHCERAIRAVQLAAPFNLPEQFYDQWDDLEWQFDRRL